MGRERTREREGAREHSRGCCPLLTHSDPLSGGARPGYRPGHARWKNQGGDGHRRAGVAPATPKGREGRELMVEIGCSGDGGGRLKKKEKLEMVGERGGRRFAEGVAFPGHSGGGQRRVRERGER